MQPLDLIVLGAYLGTVVALGSRFSRSQRSIQDYFLTGKRVPWWALLGSIVATETSTVTFISVPGYAFGGDLTFLQLALGYAAGKVVVAAVLIPSFFREDFLTAYQSLASRFGSIVGRLTASIFLITRSLADGFRLFATGLVLAAVLETLPVVAMTVDSLMPGLDQSVALLVGAVVVIGATTLAYTLLGGMSAVIWTDVAQLIVYLSGAGVAVLILLSEIPGGWREAFTLAQSAGKLTVFDFATDATRSYTFWSGLVGGMFLTAGTHGADQMFVQRYLCSGSPKEASRALVWSGVVVFVQFLLFLVIGLLLWVYYTAYAPNGLTAVMAGGVVQTDRVLPMFMMTHLPAGLRGLVVAAIVAAAMSTLSSSLNSSAASTVGDFYIPLTKKARSTRQYLRASRWATVVWSLIQLAVAVVAIELSSRIVDEVLGIQSFTGGLMLGVFLLALTSVRRPVAPLLGIVAGAVVLVGIRLFTSVSWQWYVLIGTLTTFGVGWVVGRRPSSGDRDTGAGISTP